jgi:hypothetical protein
MSKTAEVLTFIARALVATVGWIIGLLGMIARDQMLQPTDCHDPNCWRNH